MKNKKTANLFAVTTAKLVKSMAIFGASSASAFGFHQPKEPEMLRKEKK